MVDDLYRFNIFYFRNVGFTQWKKKTQTEKIQLNLEKLNSTQLPISVRHGLDGPTSEEGREARPVSQKALHGTCVRGKRGWVEANSGVN